MPFRFKKNKSLTKFIKIIAYLKNTNDWVNLPIYICQNSWVKSVVSCNTPSRLAKCSNLTWHQFHEWLEDIWRYPQLPEMYRYRILCMNRTLDYVHGSYTMCKKFPKCKLGWWAGIVQCKFAVWTVVLMFLTIFHHSRMETIWPMVKQNLVAVLPIVI